MSLTEWAHDQAALKELADHYPLLRAEAVLRWEIGDRAATALRPS